MKIEKIIIKRGRENLPDCLGVVGYNIDGAIFFKYELAEEIEEFHGWFEPDEKKAQEAFEKKRTVFHNFLVKANIEMDGGYIYTGGKENWMIFVRSVGNERKLRMAKSIDENMDWCYIPGVVYFSSEKAATKAIKKAEQLIEEGILEL